MARPASQRRPSVFEIAIGLVLTTVPAPFSPAAAIDTRVCSASSSSSSAGPTLPSKPSMLRAAADSASSRGAPLIVWPLRSAQATNVRSPSASLGSWAAEALGACEFLGLVGGGCASAGRAAMRACGRARTRARGTQPTDSGLERGCLASRSGACRPPQAEDRARVSRNGLRICLFRQVTGGARAGAIWGPLRLATSTWSS